MEAFERDVGQMDHSVVSGQFADGVGVTQICAPVIVFLVPPDDLAQIQSGDRVYVRLCAQQGQQHLAEASSGTGDQDFHLSPAFSRETPA